MSARAIGLFSCVFSIAAASACSIPSPIAPSFKGSVGVPHAGFLTDGVELPKQGKGFVWRSKMDHHFGLPRTVAIVEEAAGAVADDRPGAPPLYVGEISAKGGGALLPKHRSHRTGRDVDLMFFMSTVSGAPLAGNDFVQFGPDGLGVDKEGRFVRFDVDRQWRLVRALVTSKTAHVQWLFIARTLEAMIVEHALALGEPLQTIAMAEQVMQQPGDSLPHDDHMHMRVACEPEETATGCDGGGPTWWWFPKPKAIVATEDELLDAILGPSVVHEAPPTPVAAVDALDP
jgi:penicillin-insensitive murein endopeptidase